MGDKRLIAGAYREVVSNHRFDTGGMFDGQAGVYRDGDRYVAYVMDGWGGGCKCTRDTQDAAEKEIERLKERYFG